MFRLLAFLLDLWIPVYIALEILAPLWRKKPMFPLTRGVFRLGLGIFRIFSSSKPSHTRKKQAAERLENAKADREAALLESISERIEDETNDLREGKRNVEDLIGSRRRK